MRGIIPGVKGKRRKKSRATAARVDQVRGLETAIPMPDARIDAYLASLPDDQRMALERLRAQITRLVPAAVETTSYGIPTFTLDGRPVLGFAARKGGGSLYPFSGTFLDAHQAELKGFSRTKGSLHFTLDKPLPEALVERLTLARIAELKRGS